MIPVSRLRMTWLQRLRYSIRKRTRRFRKAVRRRRNTDDDRTADVRQDETCVPYEVRDVIERKTPLTVTVVVWSACVLKKVQGSPYSIAERRVPELIPVLGSQPAGDVSHKPGGRLPLLTARPAVTLAALRGLLPISLLGEQRHDGCEQFA